MNDENQQTEPASELEDKAAEQPMPAAAPNEEEALGMAQEQVNQAELAGDEPVEGPRFTTTDQYEPLTAPGRRPWTSISPMSEGSGWSRVAKWGALAAALSATTYLIIRRHGS